MLLDVDEFVPSSSSRNDTLFFFFSAFSFYSERNHRNNIFLEFALQLQNQKHQPGSPNFIIVSFLI